MPDGAPGSVRRRRARRLKRTMSANMARKAGRAALRRWANTVESDVPRHSRPQWVSERLKLMSLGCVATPRSASRRVNRG